MTRRYAALLIATSLIFAAPGAARAADLNELTKYLAFIEGFQHLFEFCQAEAQLPDDLVKYARDHIGERRALIFEGLNENERAKISADAPPKKKVMVDGILAFVRKEKPDMPLAEMCKQGFFQGVANSERGDEEKETAAIRKAKN